ncbi:MAG: SpoIID/LytB domain-containing protein [Candidatus Eisenbacteria bacterium]|nr:SpoIID/LytB domain-containing protein [Candidatus Eisenbacteria bacterium]
MKKKGWAIIASICCLLPAIGCFLQGCAPAVREPARRPKLQVIKVGLLVKVPGASVSSGGKVRFLSGSSGRDLLLDEDAHFKVAARRRGISVLLDGKEVFRASGTLFIKCESRDEFLKLEGKPYRGDLRVISSPDGLTFVNELSIEEYLRGVVPNEMPSSSQDLLEAVKAQAVAARTYALSRKGHYSDSGFDVLPTVQDQVYSGVLGEKPLSNRSIEETNGVVAAYHGEPIRANYSSTCGGRTSSPDEVWNQSKIPYLRSVKDRGRGHRKAFCGDSPHFRWQEVWSGEEFEAILDAFYPQYFPERSRTKIGELCDLEVRERTKSGRVSKLLIRTTEGSLVLSGDRIRLVIRRPSLHSSILRSTFFKIGTVKSNGRVKEIVMNGGGNGHGVGMCQWGAMGMARAGYAFTDILKHYYHGITLRRVY